MVDAGALLEELLHDVQVTLGGGLLQRRVAALAGEISINVGDNGEVVVEVMGRGRDGRAVTRQIRGLYQMYF